MNTKAGMIFLIFLMALLLPPSGRALAQDTLAIEGAVLDETEMADIRGGFTTPDGDFLFFSMDFMKFNLMSHSLPGSNGENSGFVNALRQQALIGKDGSIEFNLGIFQNGQTGSGGGEGSLSGAVSGMPQQLNSIIVDDSFQNFQGMNNANLISGNNNVGSIVNIINLQLGIFGKESLGSPSVTDFLNY